MSTAELIRFIRFYLVSMIISFEISAKNEQYPEYRADNMYLLLLDINRVGVFSFVICWLPRSRHIIICNYIVTSYPQLQLTSLVAQNNILQLHCDWKEPIKRQSRNRSDQWVSPWWVNYKPIQKMDDVKTQVCELYLRRYS